MRTIPDSPADPEETSVTPGPGSGSTCAEGGCLPDGELPLLMIRAVKAMVAEVTAHKQHPNPGGLTTMHGIALRYVEAHDDVTTVELAGHLGVTKQSASEIVAALEKEGYVERHPHPADGRARVVQITERGRAGLVRSRALWDDLVARWTDLVGEDDLACVRRALEAYLASAPDPA